VAILAGALSGWVGLEAQAGLWDPERAYNGYTLYQGLVEDKVLLLDMDGRVVHEWAPAGYKTTYYATPLPNGHILTLARRTKDSPAYDGVVELDWEGRVVWEYFNPDKMQAHHAYERLPNGDTLILLQELHEDWSISSASLKDDRIMEVDPDGHAVWDWRTADHFQEFGFSPEAIQTIQEKGGDWVHTNSIRTLPATDLAQFDPAFREGNILVSQRQTNIVFIIDKATGIVVWKVGPQDNLTVGQHDPKLLPSDLPGGGNLLVFDNGGAAGYPQQSRDYSRILEIDPRGPNVVWEYESVNPDDPSQNFYSAFISSAQRLPNGNTMICEGMKGRLFEVTPEGAIVWEHLHPTFLPRPDTGQLVNYVYRATRVDPAWAEPFLKK
jgi:hypothetical protein